jgi:predicted transposase YbfD/YdcC
MDAQATEDFLRRFTGLKDPRRHNWRHLFSDIITIDAMGCQIAIAEKIVQKEADFILAVKDNQPTRCAKLECVMNDVILDMTKGRPVSCGHYQQTNGGHGRIEMRNVWVSDEVWGLGPELLAQWPALRSMAVVECRRQDLSDPTGKISVERRLFISSLSGCDAKRMADAVRGHWGVENRRHWRLDLCFREDQSRLWVGHGAQNNFSRLRRIVLNKLKADPRPVSLRVKRHRCAIDRAYLLKTLKA